MTSRALSAGLLVLLILASASFRALAQAGPEVRVASNVIVVPDARAEAITGWMIVGAGCADEAEGNCRGIAHYLEHLLLIGRGPAHRPDAISLVPGGSGNGWTTHKSTTYFQRMPASPTENAANLDKLLAYFAATLRGVTVAPDVAARERDVVLQEYNRGTGANPVARFAVELNAKVLPDEPLGQRVIGSPQTIGAFKIEEAQAFHSQWYIPSNTSLVIHGPIEAPDVKALHARHFGGTEPAKVKRPPDRKLTYAAARERFDKVDKDTRLQTVSVDRVVHYENYDNARLNWARNMIGSFLTSQLPGSPYDRLLNDQGLIAAGSYSLSRVRAGALRLSISVNPANGVTPEQIAEAVERYLAGLSEAGIPDAMLTRLKTRSVDSYALTAKDPPRHAQALVGWLQGRDTYDGWLKRSDSLLAVRTEDVAHLLKALASPGREVMGVLSPPEAPAQK